MSIYNTQHQVINKGRMMITCGGPDNAPNSITIPCISIVIWHNFIQQNNKKQFIIYNGAGKRNWYNQVELIGILYTEFKQKID